MQEKRQEKRPLEETEAEGFKDGKFHPYYQDYVVDGRRMYPTYGKNRERNLMAVFHCGYDIAFPRTPACNPAKIRRRADDLPGFKLVATHFGGWMDCDEAERHIIGQPIWLDTSRTSPSLPPERLKRMAWPTRRTSFSLPRTARGPAGGRRLCCGRNLGGRRNGWRGFSGKHGTVALGDGTAQTMNRSFATSRLFADRRKRTLPKWRQCLFPNAPPSWQNTPTGNSICVAFVPKRFLPIQPSTR